MSPENRFLDEALGSEGAAAIRKAAARCPALEGVLVPRAILAWVRATTAVASQLPELTATVPGSKTSYAISKTEHGWTGWTLGKGQYSFKDSNIFQVAGAFAAALGVEVSAPLGARDVDLERLGKSMDLLAKAQVVKRELAKKQKEVLYCSLCKDPLDKDGHCKVKAHWEWQDAKKAEPAGTSAAPQAPKPPQAGGGLKPAGMTAPKGAKKPPSLRVMKSSASRPCGVCGGSQFSSGRFVGCMCFSALSKSVKVTPIGDQLQLTFGDDWSREAIVTLAEVWQ